ncbi:MAG: hypothetical protein PHE02_12640 [Lachnospiraceae bacterium]|nr:hypothetical protein [Lachnospiraceae bacterium]
MKKIGIRCFFLILLYFLLFHAKSCVQFASQGLLVWFQTMIPTLLPFMIVTSMMILLQVHRSFIRILEPFLYRIYHINGDSIYCVVFGFLCGFPMGARIVAQLYDQKYISKTEGQYLLSFCNNIGPIYFINIVFQGIRGGYHIAFLLGMYAIPILYGILMRYTLYRHMPITAHRDVTEIPRKSKLTLFLALDESIHSAFHSITTLGGYMIFFNLCTYIPICILGKMQQTNALPYLMNCVLEISSGVQNVLHSNIPWSMKEQIILVTVMFGGVSCIAQTISCIRTLNCSIFPYCVHKLIQSCFFYLYINMIYTLF